MQYHTLGQELLREVRLRVFYVKKKIETVLFVIVGIK